MARTLILRARSLHRCVADRQHFQTGYANIAPDSWRGGFIDGLPQDARHNLVYLTRVVHAHSSLPPVHCWTRLAWYEPVYMHSPAALEQVSCCCFWSHPQGTRLTMELYVIVQIGDERRESKASRAAAVVMFAREPCDICTFDRKILWTYMQLPA